jgi:hypothetical protein
MPKLFAAAALLLLAASCGRPQAPADSRSNVELPSAEAEDPEQVEPVGFEMRHVRMRAASDVVLDVDRLSGQLMARDRQFPVFDDLSSFYIAVESAQLSVDARSLTAIVNRIFDYKGSPLSDLELAFRDGRIEQKGKLHKGLTIPFSVTAAVRPENGQILLHPVSVRIVGIPAAKMMSAFGLELEDLIKVRTGRGVKVRDNDLLLEPSHVMQAPEVRGRVAAVRVADDRMILQLGTAAVPAPTMVPDSDATNYIWFHGGQIRFGRLTMSDADLQLVDADPADPFDFYSERYNEQLVAGYSRNTRAGALRTTMPDYGDLPRLSGGRLPAPPARRPRSR